jgi:hypothetical protein
MSQLEDGVNKWSMLENLIFYSPKDSKTKKHYEIIRTQFYRWSEKNIFKKAFDKITPLNNISFDKNISIDQENYIINVL